MTYTAEDFMDLWMRMDTNMLAKTFKDYCKIELHATEMDPYAPNTHNVFYALGVQYRWYKVECNHYKGKYDWESPPDLQITLRKEPRPYLTIGANGERFFECELQWVGDKDSDEEYTQQPKIVIYKENELNSLVAEHQKFFDSLFIQVRERGE